MGSLGALRRPSTLSYLEGAAHPSADPLFCATFNESSNRANPVLPLTLNAFMKSVLDMFRVFTPLGRGLTAMVCGTMSNDARRGCKRKTSYRGFSRKGGGRRDTVNDYKKALNSMEDRSLLSREVGHVHIEIRSRRSGNAPPFFGSRPV